MFLHDLELFPKDLQKYIEIVFDVTMGSFDDAEVCELVELYILHILSTKYGKKNLNSIYWDDGLARCENVSGP